MQTEHRIFYYFAERKGFEPSIRCRIHAFQACAFDHSATSLSYTELGSEYVNYK